jgi:hypothetical protein
MRDTIRPIDIFTNEQLEHFTQLHAILDLVPDHFISLRDQIYKEIRNIKDEAIDALCEKLFPE